MFESQQQTRAAIVASQTNDKRSDERRGGTTPNAQKVSNEATKIRATAKLQPSSIPFCRCRRCCPWVHWRSRSGSRDPNWHCLQQQTEHVRRNQSSPLNQTEDVSLVVVNDGVPDLRLRTGYGMLHCLTWALWSCCCHSACFRLLFGWLAGIVQGR